MYDAASLISPANSVFAASRTVASSDCNHFSNLEYRQISQKNIRSERCEFFSDDYSQKIKELNELIAKDADFENLILPLRDGVNVLRKK